MGDNIIKKINEKSIVDGVNDEKGPFSSLRKKLALKDDKKITMRTQILVNEGYCIHNIEF